MSRTYCGGMFVMIVKELNKNQYVDEFERNVIRVHYRCM